MEKSSNMQHHRPLFRVLVLLLLLFQFQNTFSQGNLITGRVTDKTGAPLPNVSILEKGGKVGATTDADGNFSLHAVQTNPVLTISLVGYTTQNIQYNGSKIFVTLEQVYSALDTAIVSIGYGYQKRVDLTASVGSVMGKDVKDLPAISVQEALQGRIAGVNVIKSSGAPGAEADVIIRGYSSVNPVPPLYIVDGVRGSGDNFNMDDIATIDVLKDASAAAIYGSEAAGGVIIITTKKGSHQHPVINFTARYGIVRPQIVNLLDKNDWLRVKRYTVPSYLNGTNTDSLPNTDWVNALYGNGNDQKYNLSISGGSENANYMVSGFYQGQKGVYIDNSNSLAGVRINSDFKITSRFKVGEQVYAYSQTTNPTNQNPAPNPPFRSIPIMAIYDSNNVAGGGWAKTPSGFQGGNPVGFELTNPMQNKFASFTGNVYGQVDLPLDLSFRATFSYAQNTSQNNNFQEPYDFGSVVQNGNKLEKSSSAYYNNLMNYVLSFNHTYGDLNINALLGYEQIKFTSDGIDISQTNQGLSPTYSFFPTSASQIQGGQPTGTYDPNGLIKSEFGRLALNYKNKYYINGSFRRDGNFTVFGPDNQYGFFPSVWGGWTISHEKFFEGISPVINFLKVRGSYGELGNSNIAAYNFTYYIQPTGSGNNFTPGGSVYIGNGQTGLSNPDIRWEDLHETNVGLDAAFLDSKLSLTLEWYNKITKNVLYNLPLPPSTGFSNTFLDNIGSIQNTGFEFTVGYHNKSGAFSYNISFNGAFNTNKILTLDGTKIGEFQDGGTDLGGGYGVQTGSPVTMNRPGHSFGEFYGYKATGIYKDAQEIAGHVQFPGQTAMPGDLIFDNVNGDTVLNDNDKTFIGNPNPKFVYGFSINMNWKGIDLSMLFNGVAGVQLYNGVKAYAQYLFSDGNTTSKVFGDSYLGSNGLTNQPRMGYLDPATNTYNFDPNGNYTRVNSYFVENGSYLKLAVLEIGYTFSPKLLSSAHINSSRIFVQGTNVFTITKYSGQDPELGGSVTAHGIDAPNQYPHTRIFSLGISLGL
jgi:TonB-linked SusC/RagA family outer membrane protein